MDDIISPCVCPPPHTHTLLEWVRNKMNSIFLKRTPTDNIPHPLAHTCRISSVQALELSDPILHEHESSTCPFTSLWSHQRTERSWLKRTHNFSFCQHTRSIRAVVRGYACVCAISTSAYVCVCVACKSASTLFTYPGYQANSVVSNTSGTSQHRRINDARAIDALNCEAPSCLCDYSPAGRSNRTHFSQQESS